MSTIAVSSPVVRFADRRLEQSVPTYSDLSWLAQVHPTVAVFLVSVFSLFFELLLIRWIGTEVRIFAYLQNTILVVCFLGLGLGCFSYRQSIGIRSMILRLLLLVALLAIPLTRKGLGNISELLSGADDFVIWNWDAEHAVSPLFFFWRIGSGLFLTFGLMLLLCLLFVPVGRLLGRLLNNHPQPIRAYSANVAGSLLGIWCFAGLSALYLPPVVWLAVAALFTLPFLAGSRATRWTDAALLLAVVALGVPAGRDSEALQTYWSPYQKLAVFATDADQPAGTYLVRVNNAGFQQILDCRPETAAADPKNYPPELLGLSQFDVPMLLHPNPRSLLIVGAGTGNDAAGGVRQGVERVVAVEIDPAVIRLGKEFHPEKPYDKHPPVEVVQDDARTFFATTTEQFDIISFAALDSHTTTGMTNVRLDHYVYTRESLEQAKKLLRPHGFVVLKFAAQKPFIADRLAGALRDVFGQEPMCFAVPDTVGYGWPGLCFVAGDLDAVRAHLATQPHLAELVQHWETDKPFELTYSTPVTTDDWPYLYLPAARVPLLFYLLAGLTALLLWVCQRMLNTNLVSGWGSSGWHFFFLGAAFLLLEVQNISKASVILGNTWHVNAVIISAVLVLVLAANVLAAFWPRLPLGLVYLCLLASCVGLYFFDLSRLAVYPYPVRAVLAGGLTTLPMFFSGIIFIRSFAPLIKKGEALGANLLGSLVGGILQSLTFVLGIKALLLIVGVFYLLAFVTRPRTTGKQAVTAETISVTGN